MEIVMENIVKNAAEQKTSDIHIVCGMPVRFRVRGDLTDFTDHILTHEDCERLARELAPSDEVDRIKAKGGEIDCAATFAGTRLRVNLFCQQGHISGTLRLLSSKIPELETLGLPPGALNFTEFRRGIVLVTGETGSGKSTTLAAMLHKINRDRCEHILTLEDPIEYIHLPIKCTINQREIGSDTSSFADGLRAALREDPDVILIGEMRDVETIETALTAAETGHLVFATLHTNSAADAIDRIVDVFPEAKHRQIRMQLSMTLKGVVAQQLLQTTTGEGRALGAEVMVVNPAIKNLIREGKTPMIANAIATSANEGAISMDNCLIGHVRAKRITAQTAVENAIDPDYVKKNVGFR